MTIISKHTKSSKNAKPKGSIIAALDVGSSKIACFIARITDDQGRFEILGVGHHASAGIKAGKIIDLKAAENAIRETVHTAENMAAKHMKGYPLREVIVNVPPVHTHSQNYNISVDISGQEVTGGDLNRALAKAQDQSLSSNDNHEIIHTIPVGYMLDGQDDIKDPAGMVGDELHVAVHLIGGNNAPLQNIARCVEHSHLDIAALCLSPYAAGLSSLVDDEIDLGCTVIDMGGGLTSFAIFYEGKMLYSDALPIGGQHVTSDIARGLTTSISDAERLKTLYGSAMATSADENEMIDVPQIGEDQQPQPHHVQRSLLIGIIQPRIEEIFELIRARITESGLSPYAGRRVILTGGASQLPGLRDLGQLVLDKKVRLGRPIRVNGLADAVSGPAFATTAGLLTYMSERHHEMPSEIMSQSDTTNPWKKAIGWISNNW